MSFESIEYSPSGAVPVECYKFTDGYSVWLYTSHDDPVTCDGDTYEPCQITRTAIITSAITNSLTTVDFSLPCDDDLVRRYCFLTHPKKLSVEVKRTHVDSPYFKITYSGELIGTETDGLFGILKMASIIQAKLNKNTRVPTYQRMCNNDLFDERCKLSRAAYTATSKVARVEGLRITVLDQFYDNDMLNGGTLTNIRTGDQQIIVKAENHILEIGYPFYDIILDDDIEMTLGCDHLRLGNCKTRFNNVTNYCGFDFMLNEAPYESLLMLNQTKTTSVTATQVVTTIGKPQPKDTPAEELHPPFEPGFSTTIS